MIQRFLWQVLLLLLVPTVALAQTGTVEGTLTDASTGEPLPGANLALEGTGLGTASGTNGRYQIVEVPPGEYTLTASFVGYTTASRQISVSAGETVTHDIALEPDFASLEELVVIGYGERSRRDITGSVASLDAEEIEDIPASSPEELLQGRAAGVQLTKSSGLPGSSITVNVRGISSIESGTQPLYVVDGVPANAGPSASYFGQTNNALQSLNPSDIASIEVLKDASATAIYGSRGANGVVLISTKTGDAQGTTDVSFGYFIGQVSPTSEWDVLSGPQYSAIMREAASNTLRDVIGVDPNQFPNPVQTVYGALLGGNIPPIPTPGEAPNYSYVDGAFREGLMQQFDLSARGGSENTRFYASGAYFTTEGFVLGNRFQRISGRVNLDHDISEGARLGARVGMTRVINDRASSDNNVSGILSSAALRPPIVPIRNEDGTFNWGNPYNIGENIIASAAENDSDDYEWRVNGNVFGEVDLMENLTLRATGGLDLVTVDEYFLNVQESVDGRPNGTREQDYREQRRYLLQGTANYTNTFAEEHLVNVIAGTSYERNERNNIIASASNYATNALRNVESGSEPITTTSTVDRKWRLVSFFSRASYTYADRYIVEASARVDGSTRFSENNRFGFFPAGAVAWRLSEESFMESAEWVDELKVRLSYGLTGNDQIDTFPYLALFTADADYGGSPALSPDQLASPDLKWETLTDLTMGVDVGLFDQRLLLTADVYRRNTTDLILPVQLPRSAGYNEVVQNVGNLRNRGVEFLVETQNLTGELNWSTSFNVAYNENEVTELVDNDGDGAGDPITPATNDLIRIEEGRALGSWYMIPFEGVDPETGLPQYLDQNGELTSSPTAADRRFVGNLNPDWTGGFMNRFGYKGVELSFLFQFETGSQFYNGTKAFLMNPRLFNAHEDMLDRWQEPGDQTDVPKLSLFDVGVNGAQDSERFLEDGSYLRLKNLTLAYALPTRLVEQLGVKHARIFVKGHNLLTFDGLSIGDPESNAASFAENAPIQGRSFFTPPQQRQIMGGVNLTF